MRLWYAVPLFTIACDIPTELPKWNPTFAVPVEGTSIPVAQVLPSSVSITPGGAFALSLAPSSFQARLSQVCPPCIALDGQTVPKPAITGAFSHSVPLPPDVLSATIVGGYVRFSITNGWTFDPLRPTGGQTGTLQVRITTPQGSQRGATLISGQTRAFPPGATLTDSVALGTGPAVTGLVLNAELNSPAGDPVRVDAQSALTVIIAPANLLATDATVHVGQRQLTAEQVQLDLTGIDDFIIGRVQGGKIVLTIGNSFGVGGTLTLAITGGFAPVTKTVTVPAGDATVEVPFTEAELETILGHVVLVSISGTVIANDAIVLTPASTFTLAALLVLELGPDS